MNSLAFALFENFLLGGVIVASISYLATYMNPLLGAIWWSFPLSLMPNVYFMWNANKSNEYISKFMLSTTYALVLLVIVTFSMSYFIKHHKSRDIISPIMKGTLIWLVCSIFFYFGIKYFNLEKHFM